MSALVTWKKTYVELQKTERGPFGALAPKLYMQQDQTSQSSRS